MSEISRTVSRFCASKTLLRGVHSFFKDFMIILPVVVLKGIPLYSRFSCYAAMKLNPRIPENSKFGQTSPKMPVICKVD
jgi:hypothetical protein